MTITENVLSLGQLCNAHFIWGSHFNQGNVVYCNNATW